MKKTAEDYEAFLNDNFIIFKKNDIIELEKAPEFGAVTFYFQDGKFSYLEKKETKK